MELKQHPWPEPDNITGTGKAAAIPSRLDLIGRCFRKFLYGWGRASRREFWAFFLLVLSVFVGVIVVELWVFNDGGISDWFFIILFAEIVLFLPPLFFAGMRRYHDIGRSGWLYLFHMLTGFGTFFALFAMFARSQPYENKHGAVPPEAKIKR